MKKKKVKDPFESDSDKENSPINNNKTIIQDQPTYLICLIMKNNSHNHHHDNSSNNKNHHQMIYLIRFEEQPAQQHPPLPNKPAKSQQLVDQIQNAS